MSFLFKGKKEDLLELATELGLEATVDMTKPMLKNLITKSAGYDEEDTKLMYEVYVLDRLQEVKVYTTLDLNNGFFHVDVNEDCQKFTYFIVNDGQFEFNKVPFGLSTCPSVFQRYIYSIFRNLMNKGLIIIYMDDLIIPSADEEEGLRKLRTVFEVASKYWLKIQFKKCQFLNRKVEFLRHIVENGPSLSETLTVRTFPQPTTLKAFWV
ncbi:retrovirus-related Pol polyprotein from transposon 17.6 [Trichonephila inaurata madagascariensis]|uniref:Retrovirus-related Pol polyprotein from transposon 17.6 n=1 Tax=Trichonephila inaurata madagascariensis TaxID=2747483 RepID=A0A8X6X8Y8_9ARAC|nr:retrovirus-related Pol polyprotein from transposon 17.6 [Trichonephila inaurata madagascariensis]